MSIQTRLRRSAAALTAAAVSATLALSALATPARADTAIIDRYGQVISASWPTKVTSDAQLRRDVAADNAYYGSLKTPKTDSYGGNPHSGRRLGLKATGWFHVENHAGRSVLVDPRGNEFFSLGTNVFCGVGDTYTHVAGREEKYAWLPDPANTADPLNAGWLNGDHEDYSFYVANQVRKYGSWDLTDNCARQVKRAKALGFNTAAGWSYLDYVTEQNFPYVAHLDDVPFREIGWSGLYDIYSPGAQAEIEASIAEQVKPYVGDRNLIGYSFFNEVQWQRLRTAVSEQPASEVASKKALVDLLKKRHGGDISSFNTAWAMNVTSFDDLLELSFTPKTDAAVIDINAFSEQYFDLFYKTFSQAIRKADPAHMVIGDRWFTQTLSDDTLRRQLATAAGKYLDVLTYNDYSWDFNTEKMAEIYRLSGHKPLMITEFHYGDPTRGLTFGIKMAANEKDKALLYRNYVEKAAASGMVVGTHWFEYLDQAATGRWFQGLDGEAGGIGFLDVTDRPYKVLHAEALKAHSAVYDLAAGRKKPYQYPFTPEQSERDSNNITQIPLASTAPVIDGVLDPTWPAGPSLTLDSGDLTEGVAEQGIEATFRLAWTPNALYLHATVTDPTPMLNDNHGFDIWDGDALELFIGPNNVNQGGGIQVADSQVIISAQPQDAKGTAESFWYNSRTDRPPIKAVVKPAPGGYTIEAEIALTSLNFGAITAPQQLRFDIGFDDGNGASRQRQYLWNGVGTNAANREKWGRAWLVNQVTAEPPGQPAPSTPVVRFPDTTAAPGDYLPVQATSMNPGEKLAVTFDGLRVGTLVADDSGRATALVRVPSASSPGNHELVVSRDSVTLAQTKVRVSRARR